MKKLGKVKTGCEKLSKFNSGLDKGIGRSLEKVLEGLEACLAEAEKKGYEGILPLIKDFIAEVQLDLENLMSLKGLMERLSGAEEEFQRLHATQREYEVKATEACREYFERRQEYVRAQAKVRYSTRRDIEKIRTEFLESAAATTRGYRILISGSPGRVEDLFDMIMSNNYRKIKLIPKTESKKFFGVLRAHEEDVLAKKEVLDYLTQEAARKISPILVREQREKARIESSFPDLKALEEACKKADELREQASRPLEDLRREIIEMRKSRVYAYSTKEKIRELREKYFSKIREIETVLEEEG